MKNPISSLLLILFSTIILTGCEANNSSSNTPSAAVQSDSSSCPPTIQHEGGSYDVNGIFLAGGGYYRTVKIGNQCWFKENLNVGTMIKESTVQTDNKIIEKYCYDYKPDNCNIYGALYLGAEAIQYISGDINTDDPKTSKVVRGICPSGWHIPSDNEFAILSDYLGGDSIAGGKLKEAGTAHWLETSKDVTNSSGFTALPSGYTFSDGSIYGDTLLDLWTSSIDDFTMQARGLVMYNIGFEKHYNSQYGNGYAVRCLKD